jgi:hypothetical protein
VLDDASHSDLNDFNTKSLTVNINHVENAGLSIDAKVIFLSSDLKKE